MPLSLTPLNQVQKLPTLPINGRVVTQPHIWYTCPAGKKALVKGEAVCTSFGAAATTSLRGGTGPIIIRNVVSAGGSTNPWMRDLQINVKFSFAIQLAAGETIDTVQDAGVNAEWDLNAFVQETPT